ncbi:MAG: AI-2E family transporter [Kofleriaceae bacterium]
MRTVVTIAALGVILTLVHFAADVVTPFMIGAVLAVAFQPMSSALDRRGVPSFVAALITTTVVLAIVAFGGFLVYLAGSNLAADLPTHGLRAAALRDDFAAMLASRGMDSAARSVTEFSFGGPATSFASSMAMRAPHFAQSLFFVLVVTAFIQLEATGYRRKLARVLGGVRKTRWLTGALHDIQRYLIVKLALSAANGILLGLWCWLWGVDSPLLWGILAFGLNFIPFIGSILAAVPPILFGLVEGGPTTAIGVAAGYLTVNLVVDNIVEPRVLGRAMGLSPLVLLLAMLIWGLVLGPVGAMLSVPLTMTLKLILERDPELRKFALLMGSEQDPTPLPTATMSGGPTVADDVQ